MERRITANEAVRTFSELLDRVRDRGEEFIVERGGEPVCRIGPFVPKGATLGDLADLLDSLPRVDEEYLSAVEEASHQQPQAPGSSWEP